MKTPAVGMPDPNVGGLTNNYIFNAIAVYVLSALLGRIFPFLPRPDGGAGNLRGFLVERLFLSWLTPVNASLGFALC